LRSKRYAQREFDHPSSTQEIAMSTETRTLDTQDLQRRVTEMYREVAEEPFKEFHFETGRTLAERLGYPPVELDTIPAEAIDSFAGVGYYFDLARIQPGETVVDLGSGSGMDSFLAARYAGESGRVIGIDMTDAQLTKARRLAVEGGFANVEFVDAQIEQLPLPDACADVVISNGVINLSPDKATVFAEAARVLRPGGRLALADIVTSVQLPLGVTCDASLWAACIGGAMQRDDYREALEAAGFELHDLKENDQYRFVSERADHATKKYGVKSVSLRAVKR
jgi:arsenite methyltransferase